jgi:DNA-binding GntR family transcriptional regulator
MACTAQFASTIELGLEAHQTLLECLRRRDPVAARKAAEEAVGLAMLAVEKAIRTHESRGRPAK